MWTINLTCTTQYAEIFIILVSYYDIKESIGFLMVFLWVKKFAFNIQ